MGPLLALAGAGANIQACIYVPATPTTLWTASFTAGGPGSRCMSSNGNDIAFQVSNAGVTCGNVGYVEEKGSDSKGDTCATETSHWVLSYNGSSGYSGSTSVEMAADMTHNTASLSKSTPGTVICASGAPCIGTSQAWPQGSQGPLFLVFQPPNAPPQ